MENFGQIGKIRSGKVAGRWKTILGSSPKEMDVPIKVDEELYFEGKFDTVAMLNMLEKKCWNWQGVITATLKSGILERAGSSKKFRACARAGCFGA